MSFVHLHTHSHYSILDGLGKIDDLVKKAVEYQMPALALTDHGVMYGAVEFFQKAKKAGIKPIIGVEAYIAKNGHTNKRAHIDIKPYHLILLAKNEIGYRNLVKLTTIAHLTGYYYKPRIDWELLEQYSEGLICLTACLQGELASHILSGNLDAAKDMIARYQKLFGQDSFYLEVQHHPSIDKQQKVNQAIFELSQETGVPVVATNDIHYPNQDDDEVQDILLCIQTKKTLSDDDRMSYVGVDLSFKSPEAMKQAFKDYPEAIENTLKVAQMCQFEMKLGETVLPHFPLPKNQNADQYLRQLAEVGLKEKAMTLTEEVDRRLNYELEVITKTGYASYFLIVADFINWAKDNSIVVGPGRGSAAGSLVSYLIGITNIDPIKYDLVFERFLNPERVSMPDIDTDFADSRRDDVLHYVADKYGHDKVAQIITFGTMAARAAIRDVGRVMGLPYNYCDRVAKLVPMFTSLQKAIDSVPELKEIMAEEDGGRLLTAALRLEGVVRHASTHACGVVITPESLDNYSPRQYGSQGEESIVVQYEGKSVESLGLLKMDFLGLSNLTIIEQTLEVIKKIHSFNLDIDNIPLDDKKTFKLLQQGKTTGVFQLESAGMKRYLKQLVPTDLEDIIAMVALYRPGPMEYIPDYINGKHGRKKPHYFHPKLQPILEKTYGVAVYQEQLLQIARNLAGFSYGEADILRKAVGKKIKELLAEQEEKVIKGMIENGIEKRVARQIWEFILPFASYGFNRSHAACYALIAYQTAYLKANYPAEFMAALLTSDQGNSDRIAIEVEECRQMGIEVLPPDVNESFTDFTVVAESLNSNRPRIRFGLVAVKGLGENIVKDIVWERKSGGSYKNLIDFLTRITSKDLNKKSLESMIKTGCLDSLADRARLWANLDKILAFVQENHKNQGNGQDSLFANLPEASLPTLGLDKVVDLDKRQQLNWEKEYLGLYVSDHPMSEFELELSEVVVSCVALKNCVNGARVRVAGVITAIKKIQTKKGDAMVFAKLEDSRGDIEVLVFPKILENNIHIWQLDNIIACAGTISDKDGETKILCNRVTMLDKENVKDSLQELLEEEAGSEFKNQKITNSVKSKIVSIDIDEPLAYEDSIKMKNIFYQYLGNSGVQLIVKRANGNKQRIMTSFKVRQNENLIKKIEAVIGEGRVAFKD